MSVVTDITYIRTHEGWLYPAVVVDLFSRKIIGWSMQSRMTKDIVLNALLMAVWRRNPQKQVLVHSDQGSQYTSHEWQSFLKSHGLEGSMSRRGNCHDNAVAESFFQLLKRERIKKKIYGTREEARSDIFDYIEMFYNSKRRHGSSGQMPPTEYENQYYQRLRSAWIIRGDSRSIAHPAFGKTSIRPNALRNSLKVYRITPYYSVASDLSDCPCPIIKLKKSFLHHRISSLFFHFYVFFCKENSNK